MPSCLLLFQAKKVIVIKKAIPGVRQSSLDGFLARAKRATKLAGEVNVLVTSSREMERLNRQFRQKNQATDVLSFPADDKTIGGVAGDIAISADIARDNARRLGHSITREIQILILHGVLHLAGYDHEQDNGKMALKEARLRKSLALPEGLIERNGSETLRAKGAKKAQRPQSKQMQVVRTNR